MSERSIAATADVAVGQRTDALSKDHRKVIFASSLGTVFEWYDFYLYGSLAAIRLWYPIAIALMTVIIGALFVRETRDNRIHG